jgi:hypothetical protein
MFGTPVRKTGNSGETVFHIEVNVTPIGVELEYTNDGLIYSKEAQPRFRTLQNLVLTELAKEKHLFKNPPSLASLEAITPNWGFVASGSKMIFSPYSIFETSSIPETNLPCLVDIQLKGIEMSRSTIRPVFKVHYLGKLKAEVDFDWGALPSPQATKEEDELYEVSDVPAATDGSVITLTDPASREREKAAAKAQILAAFAAAKEARTNAELLARDFYDKYDLSDSESAFTEWLSDSDSEEQSD